MTLLEVEPRLLLFQDIGEHFNIFCRNAHSAPGSHLLVPDFFGFWGHSLEPNRFHPKKRCDADHPYSASRKHVEHDTQ